MKHCNWTIDWWKIKTKISQFYTFPFPTPILRTKCQWLSGEEYRSSSLSVHSNFHHLGSPAFTIANQQWLGHLLTSWIPQLAEEALGDDQGEPGSVPDSLGKSARHSVLLWRSTWAHCSLAQALVAAWPHQSGKKGWQSTELTRLWYLTWLEFLCMGVHYAT